jgi:CubicO group peptidase (beta-lactamase class C family)
MKTIDFANVYLFRPLGINERKIFIADTAEKHKAFTISKTPKEEVWFAGPKDSVTAGYGLCMSAIDMAKIGQMILDNGLYNGKQIISKEWLELIFTPTAKLGERFRHMSYGYLWWIIDQDRRIYAAVGNSGNVIYINETDNIVVAISSYFKPTVFDRVDFIMNVVETSVKEMY